jgi:hypothetical protein
MRRSLADAILKAFREYAEPNLPEGLPDNHPTPLLVEFRLGDLRALARGIESIDQVIPRADRA